MLILPDTGSYVFLAEILTTAPINFPKTEPMESRCGDCRRCIDICPTGALEGPFQIDASRCLSYLSVESTDPVDKKVGIQMGNCFLGCDRCQEACPFNACKQNKVADVLPHSEDFLTMGEETFQERFGRTALDRAGLKRIQRNIMAVKAL